MTLAVVCTGPFDHPWPPKPQADEDVQDCDEGHGCNEEHQSRNVEGMLDKLPLEGALGGLWKLISTGILLYHNPKLDRLEENID